MHRIEQTAAVIDQTLQQLDPLRMEQEFPLPVLAQKTTVAFMLVHLATHLGYHLGQVN